MAIPRITPIFADLAPEAIGHYSHAMHAGDFLFISGQLPVEKESNSIAKKTIEEQTHKVIDNIEHILHSQDLKLFHVVRSEIFLSDINNFHKMNAVYAQRFGDHKPARHAFEVSRLPMDALVEISCLAYTKKQ